MIKSKICTKCKNEFPSTEEYFYKSTYIKMDGSIGLNSQCKKCYCNQNKLYQQSNEGRIKHNLSNRKWRKSKKGKKTINKYQHTDKYKKYYKDWQQSDDGKKCQKKNTNKYLKTEKGKKWINKINNKRRNKGYIELFPNPFSESEEVEWHHIGDSAYVVAFPRDLHRLYTGKFKYHTDWCMNIIKQVYFS